MWVATGDVKIRFASNEVAKTIYYRQREQSRGKNTGLGHLKSKKWKRSATIIPNGVSRGDARNAALGKAYLACRKVRGLENLLLQALMQKTATKLYAVVLLIPRNEYHTIPTDFIGDISTALATTNDSKNKSVKLPRLSLLNVMERFRIHEVGGDT